MRYAWERFPNVDVQAINIDFKFPDAHIMFGKISSFGKEIPQDVRDFYELILAIPGVEDLHPRGYKMSVTKAKVFGWDEIQGKIVGSVRARFDPSGDIDEVPIEMNQ